MTAGTTPVWTWLPGNHEPILAGQLGIGHFSYDPAYKAHAAARALDPLQLPLTRRASAIRLPVAPGLPGVVLDAMPAGYGADRLNAHHQRELTALELLELGPPDGVGAIEACHGIERKLAWQPHSLDELLAQVQQLEDNAPSSRAIRRMDGDVATSAGGERPKTTIADEGSLWLAKLQDRGDAPHMPAREYVAMQMAQDLGLRVPRTRLITHEQREIFLVERFDRTGDPHHPARHLFASARTVLGLPPATTSGDPRRSYLVLADRMRRWIPEPAHLASDLQELWRRMVFNALVGNGDDHPLNHGLLHDGQGWRLSPAFDITPQPTFKGILALSVSPDGSQHASVPHLLASHTRFGLGLADAVTWLGNAARHVATQWERRFKDAGIPQPRIASFAPAFAMAIDIAESPQRLHACTEALGQAERRGRKPG